MSTAEKDVVSPLPSPQQIERLADAVAGLGSSQLIWASGYLAGVAAGPRAEVSVTDGATATQEAPWTILYATETGNSRRVAEALAIRVNDAGASASAIDVRDYKPARLRKETNVIIVAATHGLGDAPDGAEDFYDYLMGERVPKLPDLNYSVLALGDSSYDDYCKVGQDIDARLAQLGATRVAPRIDCDVDFEDAAQSWSQSVLDYVIEHRGSSAAAPAPHLRAVPVTPQYSRANPFAAPVLVNQKITGRDSSKTVQHIELSLEGSGLDYAPGDSLGVMPVNPAALADELLATLELDAKAQVSVDDEVMDLRQALLEKFEITTLSRGFINYYAEKTNHQELAAEVAALEGETLRRFLYERQVVDLVQEYPAKIGAQDFVAGLRKLTPRLYSIASSLQANPDEVHLTVGLVQYERGGRERTGSASHFLARADGTVPVYVESNPHFRLPDNPDDPVIMIGPGTGIAPFRAFLQQREEAGAAGDNWLIFGDRNFRADFLYQTEMQRYLKSGVLQRLDVAFSRDQAQKIYVQDRLRENADALYQWLERGAHLYVCGDAERMAPDVHAALQDIVMAGGGVDRTQAEDYLRELKRQHRYQRDVY